MTEQERTALAALLYQLADDDFLYAFRGSEWLGLAPHIEEDVASSSIAQDSMGHAAMYYQLLEELGEGKADALAHVRLAHERKNSILVERVNGPGYYMETPEYDWAYAVVRNYCYTLAKKIRIDALKNSSYAPLAAAAVKINMELYYHLLHWQTWFTQLYQATPTARQKMDAALEQVLADFGDMFDYGAHGDVIEEMRLIEGQGILLDRWYQTLTPTLVELNVTLPEMRMSVNGRNGEHSADLNDALSTLGEVYLIDQSAVW
ncbi:1,2-phenylacetyl-CoA epoxidase subunit PaaC [Exiguobacterium sp. H66]|uniref:1,2-phenylacetyl-CoA epoxidase subunit PaaC n=1 Tax=Exiguobacterium sp. H66 TaxID=2751208 RepID=UPI001BE64350|nr:1,2-phenylacetyl-CoA epoxidase subunit PaaC [Exiguobacterium sp. H66]